MDNPIFGDVRIVLREEDQEKLRALAAHPNIHCNHVTLGSLPKRERSRLPGLAEIIGIFLLTTILVSTTVATHKETDA
tara:strand:- start:180 stop:413 length:234 start_codon:yes stop_codon:yes gene_type:complete